jgi:hypothetical protein
VSKEGVRFVLDSEATQVRIFLRQTDATRERYEAEFQVKSEDEEEPSDSEKKKR